jgi:hypothetical protein
MVRWLVDISGGYYDFYPDITDFGIVHLSLLPSGINNYEWEAQLAIL